ncbi:hypothetical protein AYI70_g3147 [Smittium culicis]|uniref:DUF7492 domain-containing protein n=1 Tax=Smittium culicis TaxID=133412 RepID=A0A1R1Y520_9FUNG|nr:hypothetical protein AYI70_g3146 [Smittium culicis]OMJ21989.1 hypothetical protein AYI70_g3147 [Smittium culicis]
MGLISAHSWVDCTKFNDATGSCEGYPRGYPGRANPSINTIYTYLITGDPESQPICKPGTQDFENYSDEFPMAIANSGDTIRTTWEANGHYNPFRLTYATIYFSNFPNFLQEDYNKQHPQHNSSPIIKSALSRDSSSNSPFELVNKTTFVFASHTNCINPQDPNSVCFVDWEVPKVLVPNNTYSFFWVWNFDFNPAGEVYTSCFDIHIY